MLLSPAKDLLSRHRCLPRPAADFILKSPLSKLSHHLSLHRRTAGSAFLRALTLLSSLHCFCHCAAARFIVTHRSLHRCAASSAFVVAPPRPSLSRRRSLPCRAAGFAFVIAPPPVLHLSLRRRCLPCRAAAAFVIAMPPASSSRRRSIFFTSSHLDCPK